MGVRHFTFNRRHLAIFLTLLLLLSFTQQTAQVWSSVNGPFSATDKPDRVQLHQALLDLTNPFTVMCVAAHPDDEDGNTLTVLRRKYGVHTVSLFTTYGEGGQNAVGPELYEDLGVIRARETMAAAEVQGSEPHFLGLPDFGFSKSADEAFRVWGEKEALRRMVLQIRRLRPDVIITNHNTTSGHGHHQATGRLILQAFDAAADPKQFPEQLGEVTTWQAQRLFVRVQRNQNDEPAATQTAPSQLVTIDPNERDPIRGTTYAEQAHAGLQQHATQGPWSKTLGPNGARVIRYNLVRQIQTAAALPANARSVIDGLQLPEQIKSSFTAPTIDKKPLTEFVDNRGEVLVSLINARKHGAFTASKEVMALDPHRFQLMTARLDKALALTAGITFALNTSEHVIVPGIETRFSGTLTNSGDAEIQIKRVELSGMGSKKEIETADKLLPGTDTSLDTTVVADKNQPLTVPSSAHLYDGNLFGQLFSLEANLQIEDASFSVKATKKMDVAPAVEISDLDPSPFVSTPMIWHRPTKFTIKLKNNLSSQFHGVVKLNGQSLETGREVAIEPNGSQTVVLEVRTTIPINRRQRGSSDLSVSVVPSEGNDAITRKTISSVFVDLRVAPGLRVGYISSFDKTLSKALAELGVDSRELSVGEVQTGALAGFDTLIIDNRGYEAHPELIKANDQLLKFVENGGTLIVFYHKTNEWNPDERAKRPQLAPYPIILSDDRVTEEDAPIQFLLPQHPLLTRPNRITQKDFENWIQERGLYYPKEWDSHYAALFSTHDKGEPPLKGGLLVGHYGKGNYIYTSMVWYRQLRGGIPGGYRFFANLISYGKYLR